MKWNWVTGFPYLMVNAPSPHRGTDREPWHRRTITVARHIVCLDGVMKEEKDE